MSFCRIDRLPLYRLPIDFVFIRHTRFRGYDENLLRIGIRILA